MTASISNPIELLCSLMEISLNPKRLMFLSPSNAFISAVMFFVQEPIEKVLERLGSAVEGHSQSQTLCLPN